MDLKKLLSQRYLVHIVIISTIILYILSANYIFLYAFDVCGEAQVQNIDIPVDTGDILYYIDGAEITKIQWKDIVRISGWAFIEKKDSYNSTIYIAIITADEKLIFNTNMMMRPDVTQHFRYMDLDLDYSGFETNIPLEILPHGTHQIGIMINEDDGERMSYINTDVYLVKDGDSIEMKKT